MGINVEIGLAFRDQNWGERQIELRELLGKTCLMLGSELRGQMVRICRSEMGEPPEQGKSEAGENETSSGELVRI